mmetsp:Transcript_24439/g.45504  ORF Transcript_24439/g.45504 Transcript_24439/m.45504 type:complete len:278 (+) Transcript_24439:2278-3111(+)
MIQIGVVGQGGVDRHAVPQDDPIRLRAGKKLGPFPRAADDQIGGCARLQGRRVKAAGCCRVGQKGLGPSIARVVQLADPRRLAHDLKHVHVAIRIKRIAGVVGGKADSDPARLHLVDQCDPAMARGASLLPVLKIEVAHRQADHVQPCARHQVEGFERRGLLHGGERTQVTHGDGQVKAVVQHRLGDIAERVDLWVERFVHMEIKRQSPVLRRTDIGCKLGLQGVIGDRQTAQHPAMSCDQIHDGCEIIRVVRHGAIAEAGGLQIDPVRPFGAQFGE